VLRRLESAESIAEERGAASTTGLPLLIVRALGFIGAVVVETDVPGILTPSVAEICTIVGRNEVRLGSLGNLPKSN